MVMSWCLEWKYQISVDEKVKLFVKIMATSDIF